MPLTSDAVQTYVRSTQGVRALSKRTVAAVWAELPGDAVKASDLLTRAIPTLTERMAELVAVAATDFYDEVRDTPGAGSAELISLPPREQVAASTRWAVTPMFGTDPDATRARARVISVVDRIATNHGHDVIVAAGENDPKRPRFARVPVGDTCAFCRLLASRGAVYRSQVSAQMRRSHADCDCKVSPVFDGDDLPYDRQALLEEYNAAARAAGSSSVKQIAAKMRTGTTAG